MWEAIRSNIRRSRILIFLMGVILVGLGFVIGTALDPQNGGVVGAFAALVLWFILWMTALLGGDDLLLQSAGAHKIEKMDAPQLWNVVEEMTLAAGLPKMPDIYIIEDDAPNAFAVGRKPTVAAVCATTGLLRRLNRDELEGVIGHEIGHVHNLDIRFMTLASVMLGAIVMIADMFFRILWYGGGRRTSRRSDDNGGGQAQAIFMVVAIALAIIAPILAQLLYFACSRRREYLADASSARFTRYPPGLASALRKIEGTAQAMSVNRAVAPLFIVNPLQGESAIGLFSTHPPTEKRIQILLGMSGGAGYADYEAAFKEVHGGSGGCIGARTLREAEKVSIRAGSVEPESREATVERLRGVSNMLGRLGNFLTIPCECGVNIKVPPNFTGDSVPCPRCGRENPVPRG